MKRTIALTIALAVLIGCAAVFPAQVRAGTVTETVNVQYFDRNTSGDGYNWNNRTKTLTLTGLTLVTSSDYGMRIPSGATVVLQGNNSIRAASVALAVEGEVTFRGEGSLTLVGGTYGLYGYSTYANHIARYEATGPLEITAGLAGIRFDYAKFYAESGSAIRITTQGSDAAAIDGTVVRLQDCSLKADAPLKASVSLVLQNADISVFASSAALAAPRNLEVTYEKIEAGESESSLVFVDSYGGQNAVRMTHTGREGRPSVIFGGNVPAFVDYLIFGAVILAAAAAIAVPLIRRKRKNKKARAAIGALETPEPLSPSMTKPSKNLAGQNARSGRKR